jgi:hypothetical protein
MNMKDSKEDSILKGVKNSMSKVEGIKEMVNEIRGGFKNFDRENLALFGSTLGALTRKPKKELSAQEKEDLIKIIQESENKSYGSGKFESRNEYAKMLPKMNKPPATKAKQNLKTKIQSSAFDSEGKRYNFSEKTDTPDQVQEKPISGKHIDLPKEKSTQKKNRKKKKI